MKIASSILFVLCCCLCTSAFSQTIDSNDPIIAFEQGKTFFKNGSYAEAAGAFRHAYRLKPNWKLLFNIAQSEAAAKRHGLALEAFEQYLTEGGDDIQSMRYNEVRDEVRRLRDVVGAVEIHAPDNSKISINGIERGIAPLPGPLLIAAGTEHEIIVTVDGKTVFERKIRVSGQKTLTVEVTEKEPEPVEPPAQTKTIIIKEQLTDESVDSIPDQKENKAAIVKPELDDEIQKPNAGLPTKSKSSKLKTIGGVTLGFGGAMIVAGAVTGGMALSTSGELSGDCPGGKCPEEFWDKNNKLETLTNTTNALLGIGIGLAVTGVVLLIIERSKDDNDSNIAIVPLGAPSSVGIGARGRF